MDLFLLMAFDDANNVMAMENDLLHPLNVPFGDQREIVNRNENYYEITIPRYTIDQFKSHFRMSRQTFEDLLVVVSNNIEHDRALKVPLQKKLLFTIWIVSKPESFLAAGDRFGLSKGNAHFIFKQIIDVLVRLAPTYIRWPEVPQQQIISETFEARSHGIYGVVGAIDGCHIPCKQPIGNPHDYYNRKGFHSIVLQAVCDHKRRFTDIFVGMSGRMHDARVFRNSGLFHRLTDVDQPLLETNYHIIGDSAYPLMTNLMVPFRDTGHLNARQVLYNTRLSSIRSTIERAFALLKGKFRRLKYLDISDFDLGNNIIAAACVLHNVIIESGEDEEEDYDVEADEIINDDEPAEAMLHEANLKRQRIVDNL